MQCEEERKNNSTISYYNRLLKFKSGAQNTAFIILTSLALSYQFCTILRGWLIEHQMYQIDLILLAVSLQ